MFFSIEMAGNSALGALQKLGEGAPTTLVIQWLYYGYRTMVITIWLFNIAMENGSSIDDFPS